MARAFFVDTSAKQQLRERLSQLILEVDVIVIAGSLPQGFSAEELSTLILWLQSAGKKVAVDYQWCCVESSNCCPSLVD